MASSASASSSSSSKRGTKRKTTTTASSSSSGKMFNAMKAMIVRGNTMSETQRNIFVRLFTENGGSVVNAYDKRIDLVICAPETTKTTLFSELGTKRLPSNICVVRHDWLSQCMTKGQKLPYDAYIHSFTTTTTTTTASPPAPSLITSFFQVDTLLSKKPTTTTTTTTAAASSPSSPYTVEWKWNAGGKRHMLDMVHKDSLESVRVAAFDLDSTLIETKSGNQFARNWQDWRWYNRQVIPKLRQLHDDGYRVVVFSNQAGVNRNRPTPEDLVRKLHAIQHELKVPVHFLCAALNDKMDGGMYRKPAIGMWHVMCSHLHPLIVDKGASFFVGDAADSRRNHSDSDRRFAEQVGIAFHEPHHFFTAAATAATTTTIINPAPPASVVSSVACPACTFVNASELKECTICGTALPSSSSSSSSAKTRACTRCTLVVDDGKAVTCPACEAPLPSSSAPNGIPTVSPTTTMPPASSPSSSSSFAFAKSPPPPPQLGESDGKLDLVVFVGSPASGKTTYYEQYFAPRHYEHVNQDTLKTRDKCVKVAREALRRGRSVVVDNTNGDVNVRALYVDLGAEFDNVNVWCVHFVTDDATAHIMNQQRGAEGGRKVPGIAFNMHKKRYSPPTTAEGFSQVFVVDNSNCL